MISRLVSLGISMDIKSLLNRIQEVNKKYEQFAKLSGDNFNVFSVLGLNSAENMHSLFIAELLDPNGTHGQGCLYLSLFLEELDLIESYKELNSAKVITEKHIGEIDKDFLEGGRIDIFIEHLSNNIIIENKIYAGDQYNQLYRYYQFDKNAWIIYLTLDGSPPTKESLGELSIDKVTCISYAKHIIDWLNICIEKSASLPIVRETVIQYRNTIKELTHQCSNRDKEMEVTNILLSSEENFKAAQNIANQINSLVKIHDEILKIIHKRLCSKYKSETTDLVLFTFLDYEIKLNITYEYGWFHYGIFPSKNNKWGFSYDKELTKIDRLLHKYFDTKYPTENPDARFAELSEYCKKYRDGDKNKFIKGYYRSPESAKNYFCWIPFNKIEEDINYAFYKDEMTFKDYAWLYNSDNQNKLIDYALELCDEIIKSIKDSIADPSVVFMV